MSKEQAKVFDEIVNYAKEKGVNVVKRIAEQRKMVKQLYTDRYAIISRIYVVI